MKESGNTKGENLFGEILFRDVNIYYTINIEIFQDIKERWVRLNYAKVPGFFTNHFVAGDENLYSAAINIGSIGEADRNVIFSSFQVTVY